MEYDAEAAQMKAYAELHGRSYPLEKASSFGKKDGAFEPYQENVPRERRAVAGTTETSNSNEHLIANRIVLQEDTPTSRRSHFKVICQIIVILLVFGILWVPGILSWVGFPKETILGVPFLFWSIWSTVVWAGFWFVIAVSYVSPLKSASNASSVHRWQHIHEVRAAHRYHGILIWTTVIWISFQPLIVRKLPSKAPAENAAIISMISRLLLGINICTSFLALVKFSIQNISEKFHERSYAKRIQDLEKNLQTLRILYRNTVDIVIRSHARDSELMSDSKLQTDRADFKLQMQGQAPEPFRRLALSTAGKARLLARRIFYSFSRPGANYLIAEDIATYFLTLEDAAVAFAFFDKDGNGDVSREELEAACLEFYHDQVAVAHSMRDMNAAVSQLDSIMMSLGFVACAVVISVVMDAQIAPLIAGIGALVLGLSWVMGGSLQEVMTSIIFLFAKHPFDVGDSVIIKNECYTVKEIKLLSTVFTDTNSTLVQISNYQLNNLAIHNNRRSSHMSETFTFEVDYSTTFQEVEKVREGMLKFLKSENRDFQPVFDLMVKDFSGLSKIILTADIKYKSNNVELKVTRRNKWLCALKSTLAELHIHGPTGV